MVPHRRQEWKLHCLRLLPTHLYQSKATAAKKMEIFPFVAISAPGNLVKTYNNQGPASEIAGLYGEIHCVRGEGDYFIFILSIELNYNLITSM